MRQLVDPTDQEARKNEIAAWHSGAEYSRSQIEKGIIKSNHLCPWGVL